MKSLFENITDDEYNTLEWVLHNPGSVPADLFFTDPTVDGRIQELENVGLVSINANGLSITELGRAALVEHDKIVEIKNRVEKQRQEELSALNALAESAMKQAKISEQEAASAKKDARFSKFMSIIAIIISIAAIIVPIIFG